MKKVSWKFNDSIESLLANNNELNINLSLESRDKIFDSSISFFSSDISNIDSLKLLRFLSIDEINHYNSIESDGQKRKFLDSNICSKYSIANLSKYQNLEDIEIYRGIFGQPYVIFQQYPKFDISIANKIIDSKNIACAIAFDKKFPMAIDLENLDNKNAKEIKTQLTNFEIDNFIKSDQDLILLWSVKEAISKITMSGLYADFKIYEISEMIKKDDHIECYFKYFSQYKTHYKIIDKMLLTIIYHKDYSILHI